MDPWPGMLAATRWQAGAAVAIAVLVLLLVVVLLVLRRNHRDLQELQRGEVPDPLDDAPGRGPGP